MLKTTRNNDQQTHRQVKLAKNKCVTLVSRLLSRLVKEFIVCLFFLALIVYLAMTHHWIGVSIIAIGASLCALLLKRYFQHSLDSQIKMSENLLREKFYWQGSYEKNRRFMIDLLGRLISDLNTVAGSSILAYLDILHTLIKSNRFQGKSDSPEQFLMLIKLFDWGLCYYFGDVNDSCHYEKGALLAFQEKITELKSGANAQELEMILLVLNATGLRNN